MTRTQRELPEGSLYLPIKTEFEQRTQHAKHGVKAMQREVFSSQIARQLLGRGKVRKTYWIGPFKWQTWLLEVFGLLNVWNWFFRRRFGLYKLG